MNKFIEENDEGLEVGSSAGFAKYFIKIKILRYLILVMMNI